MGVWSVSTPAGSDLISQGDDRIRELKTAIQEALQGGTTEGLEAVFPGSAPTTAPVFHYRGLKGATGARPSSGQYGLYYDSTKNLFSRDNGATWDDVGVNPETEAIHQVVAASLASVLGVITLPETGNAFNVSGSETITSIAGWSAGIVIIKWTSARIITHSSSLVLRGAINRTVAADDVSIFMFSASNTCREIGFYGSALATGGTAPTRQVFTSGSANYTTPANCAQIKVRMIGGGGGGGEGNSGGNAGTAGTASSFNSITAAGGSAGGPGSATGAAGGAGGTGGSGSASFRIVGGSGDSGSNVGGNSSSGGGGNGAFGGGAGAVRGNSDGAGAAGAANSGGGGSGGYGSGSFGGGGGSGEYIEIIIAPTSGQVFAYVVGPGGAGGTGSAQPDGGAGGSGFIVVDEYY